MVLPIHPATCATEKVARAAIVAVVEEGKVMGKPKRTLSERLIADLIDLKGTRTELDTPIRDFLRNERTAYEIDEEQVGQGLLILMVWSSVRQLADLSRRLERVTWVLIFLTAVLLALTTLLVFSDLN